MLDIFVEINQKRGCRQKDSGSVLICWSQGAGNDHTANKGNQFCYKINPNGCVTCKKLDNLQEIKTIYFNKTMGLVALLNSDTVVLRPKCFIFYNDLQMIEGITEVVTMDHSGSMNVCNKFHGNPSKIVKTYHSKQNTNLTVIPQGKLGITKVIRTHPFGTANVSIHLVR